MATLHSLRVEACAMLKLKAYFFFLSQGKFLDKAHLP